MWYFVSSATVALRVWMQAVFAFFITSKIFCAAGCLSCSLRALRTDPRSCQSSISAMGPGPCRGNKSECFRSISGSHNVASFSLLVGVPRPNKLANVWIVPKLLRQYLVKMKKDKQKKKKVLIPTCGFLFCCSSITMVIWVCQFITHCSNVSNISGLLSNTSTSCSRSTSGIWSVISSKRNNSNSDWNSCHKLIKNESSYFFCIMTAIKNIKWKHNLFLVT